MWKMLGLLALGLALGGGVVWYTHSGAGTESLLVTGADAQNVDVQRSLAALDRRVRELTLQVRSLQDGSGRPAAASGQGAPAANGEQRRPGDWQGFREGGRTPENVAAMRERLQERENERIKASGLTPERVQDINRRAEELRVAAMQAQYEAQRNGQRAEGTNLEQSLRKELGDAEIRALSQGNRPAHRSARDGSAGHFCGRALRPQGRRRDRVLWRNAGVRCP